jgi:diguanylate cyclase (GGDEF)-like protein/PAS domain S-box-containing protein
MSDPKPNFLTVQSLPALAWLDTPVWVFDLEHCRMVWANPGGLEFWHADSLDELRSRDFSDMSESTRARLSAQMELLQRGESVSAAWTSYPKGNPVTYRIKRTGMLLSDGRLAMLAEARSLEGDALPPSTRRDLEVLQHASSRISLHRSDGVAIVRNSAAISEFGPVDEAAGRDDLAAQVGGAEQARRILDTVAAGLVFTGRVQVTTGRGERWHEISARPMRDPVSGTTCILLNAQDVTATQQAEARLALENTMLSRISASLSLHDSLCAVVEAVEQVSPGMLCSVLLLDRDGKHLRSGVAPNLPAEYTAFVDGVEIGPQVGSCGTAAFTGQLVVVGDIATDPKWAAFKEIALRHGLQACWSVPITGSSGRVLGTFAMYYRAPRTPTAHELQLMETATRLAGIAIERARAQEALERREQELRTVMDSVPAMICYADREARFVYLNRRFADWLGFPRDSLIGRPVREVVDAETFQVMQPHIAHVLAGGEVHYERRQRAHDGRQYDFDVHYLPHFDSAGSVCGYFVMLNDVTARKQDEELLYFLANHDQLTALPNRNLFAEHLGRAIAQEARQGEKLAVLFLDLDRFKNVNDTLGHNAGDVLLQRVAGRLREALRESDLVARLGGDEYTVLLQPLADVQEAAVCAQKLIDALARPIEIDGHELFVTCSIGISVFPEDAKDAATLLKNADSAMYKAKEQGKNTYQFFSDEAAAHNFEHLMLETNLRRALEREEFVLHFQPIVDLRQRRVTGMEALVRWQHPDFGMVAPARFIPLAEETGLILPIGAWVLEQACRQTRALQQQGFADLHVAVNLSPKQFRQKNLVRSIAGILARSGLDPRFLELEVTESSIMEHADITIRTLHELKSMGIHLSIDDFGTGYSSLSYLKRFPIDSLKVDQSFVRDIPGDPEDAAIASAVIALGHSLRLTIVAEGVETAEQLTFMRERGCHRVQGYFFARPMTVAELPEYLSGSGAKGRLAA